MCSVTRYMYLSYHAGMPLYVHGSTEIFLLLAMAKAKRVKRF